MELFDYTSQMCSETENIILTPFKEQKLSKCANCYVNAGVNYHILSLASDS